MLNYILLFIIIVLLFLLIKSRCHSEEPMVHFPFRAIWREMPREEPFNMSSKDCIPPPYPKTQQIYEPSPPTQLQQQLQQMKQVHEIYPISYSQGETYDRMYNVRPSMYGALTLRDTERPYQDINTEFQRVGNVFSVDTKDDTVMTLYRRDIAPERDLYEYKIVDKSNGNNVEIFLSTNTTLLHNKDKIMIPGYENKGLFEVNLDSRYRYSRLNPII